MIEKQNRKECLFSLFSALIVVICSFTGVVMNLTTLYDENFDHMGIQTFCMFTVNSNILVSMAMGLVIPYAIDGLRKRYFHLPNWLITFLHIGVVSVALTFLVSLFVLAPVKGFHLIFTGSRFFLHGVAPVLAILAFCFFITDHHLSWMECLLGIIPMCIYGFVYYTLVKLVGEENGGWSDFYGFFRYLPPWAAIVLMLALTFGISCGIRALHNLAFRRLREVKVKDEFSEEYLISEIQYLAKQNASTDLLHTDIVIPRRFIKFLIENTDSNKTVREACTMYLNCFLDNTKY